MGGSEGRKTKGKICNCSAISNTYKIITRHLSIRQQEFNTEPYVVP